MVKTSQMPLLVIEDSDEDFEMLQILMEDMSVSNPVYRVKTGDKALDFIDQFEESLPGSEVGTTVDDRSPDSIPRPAIILLDLNLPGVDGREVLAQLKRNKRLQEIPVVVFTTSSDPTDICHCYQTGANGYLIKPVDVDQLERKVQAFVHYWLHANTTSDWGKVNLLR